MKFLKYFVQYLVIIILVTVFVNCNSKNNKEININDTLILENDTSKFSFYDDLCEKMNSIKKIENSHFFKDSTFFVNDLDTCLIRVKKGIRVRTKEYQEVKVANRSNVYFEKYIRQYHDTIFEFKTCDSSEYPLIIFAFDNEKKPQRCINIDKDSDVLLINHFKKCSFEFSLFSIVSLRAATSHNKNISNSLGLLIIEKKHGVVGIGLNNNTSDMDILYLKN